MFCRRSAPSVWKLDKHRKWTNRHVTTNPPSSFKLERVTSPSRPPGLFPSQQPAANSQPTRQPANPWIPWQYDEIHEIYWNHKRWNSSQRMISEESFYMNRIAITRPLISTNSDGYKWASMHHTTEKTELNWIELSREVNSFLPREWKEDQGRFLLTSIKTLRKDGRRSSMRTASLSLRDNTLLAEGE